MKFLLSLFTIFLSFSTLYSGQVLLKGKVLDKITNEPHEVEITFVDQSGKKIKVRSNKLTGEYQQLLEGGTAYEATVMAGDIYRETFSLNTRVSDSSFVEQYDNLMVVTLNSGRELNKYQGFSGGSLTPDAEKELKEINKILRFNRGLTMDIIVADESKKGLVEPKVMKFKAVAKRINLVIDPSVGDNIVYKVNMNENLFGDE